MEPRHLPQQPKASMPTPLRIGFAIFMMVVFVFVGVLLLFNGFGWFGPLGIIYDPSWDWLRWVGGPILILYGIFRAIRFYNSTRPDN